MPEGAEMVKPDGALARLDHSPFPGGRSAVEFIELPERKTLMWSVFLIA